MIDKQAAIDAILSESIFKTVSELEKAVVYGREFDDWTGGLLSAILAIEDMDEMD